jgi:hypothetical protein
MGHDRRRDHDRLELRVGEQLVEVLCHPRARVARGEAGPVLV